MKTETGFVLREKIDRDGELRLTLGYDENCMPTALADKALIVTSLAGIYAGQVTFYGQSVPAALAQFAERRDPAVAASLLTSILLGWARSNEEQVVCTVGSICTQLGRSDISPESVRLSFDIRAAGEAALAEVAATISRFTSDIENGRSQVKSTVEYFRREKPLALSEAGAARLCAEAEAQGVQYEKVAGFSGLAPDQLGDGQKVSVVVLPDGLSFSA